MENKKTNDVFWFAAGGVALAAWFALNVARGNPQVDEGIYIYKARQILDGARLYGDTAWTQTPLFPYVFAVLLKVFGFSLTAARTANLIFVFAAIGFAAALVRRELPERDGALLWATIFLTPLVGYYMILVKHHGMETAGMLGAMWLLRRDNLREEIRLPAAMALMCAVGCVRVTYCAAPPVLFLWMAIFHRKKPLAVALAALAGAAVFGVVYVEFIRDVADQARFGIWNLTAGLFPAPEGGRAALMVMRAYFVKSVFTSYLPAIGFVTILWIMVLAKKGAGTFAFLWRDPWLLLAFGLPLTWISPCAFTNNPQTNWLIGAVILWSVGGASLLRELKAGGGLAARKEFVPVVLAILYAAAALLNFPFGFSRHDPIASLKESARLVDQYVRPEDVFFSCQVFEGTTSRGILAPNSELSIFGYKENMTSSDPTVRRQHILTRDQLARALTQKGLKVVILAKNYCPDFSKPPLRDALEKNYRVAKTLENYGQGQQAASFYVAR